MTLVQTIDKIVSWLDTDVCSQISLKLPDDDRNDKDYGVKYVKPAAFPLYVPGKDRLPPSVPAPVPSVCVQLMENKDDLIKKRREMEIRLCLACWNPGKHGGEIYTAKKNPDAQFGYTYFLRQGADAEEYTRNMEGWRDAFNFADLVLRALEGTEYIEGIRLVKESEIKFGIFTEDGAVWDYYPYWHSWISFTLETGVVARPPEAYTDLL